MPIDPFPSTDEPSHTLGATEPEERPSPTRLLVQRIFVGADGLRAGWSLLVYFVLLALLLAAAEAVAGNLHPHAHTAAATPPAQKTITVRAALINEWLQAGAVALATLVMATVERRRFAAFGFDTKRGLRLFGGGFLWGLVFLSALVFALQAQGLLVFDGRLLFGGTATRFGVLWLVAFLGVGCFEEVFFRGYLLLTLSRGIAAVYRRLGAASSDAFGFWTSAVILSFGFGLVHKSNPGESPVGLFAAGVAGLVFCLSLWRTGSLWWAIGFHATWDWAESYLYGVPDSGNVMEGHLFATHAQGSALLSGGLTGPEGSVWVLPVLVIAAVVIILTLPREGRGTTVADIGAM